MSPDRSYTDTGRLPPRPTAAPWREAGCLLLALVFAAWAGAASDTSYAVQASATAQSTPAQITLSWTPGPASSNATGYSLSRKEAGATAWTPLINPTATTTEYVDTNVTVGRLYEYQIVRQAPGLTGYGYVAAGIDLPAAGFRGRVILVVDNSISGPLSAEIDRLVRDLTGDGWTVTRRDVGRGDTPATVREAIRGAYNEDRANTRAVFLLGHVPVARSGNLDADGHGGRPLPTDAFYGDMDGNWTDGNGDGVFDQDRIPSDVDLMVGRVDFADMPSFGSETELLRRYLGKNHDFRHAIRRVTPRALMGDGFGDFGGEAFAASGFRAFPALLGPGRTTIANVEDNGLASERWISRLTAQDWLWVYGAGAGDTTAIGGLGLHGAFDDLWSTDLVNLGARGTFYLLFGSWLLDWSKPDNIMRAALAAPNYGLTAAWAGRPHLFFQHMAMGETIGFGVRLSQNNTSLYTNAVNRHTRGIHIALMGDPTLRMQVVAPASGLQVAPGGGPPALSWNASSEAEAGYHVYRATSDAGPFTRVTTSPVTSRMFTDNSAPAGTFTYMVRAVRREVSGSGTYFNQSQGIFAQATVTNPAPNPAPGPTPTPQPGPAPSPGGTSGGGAPSSGLLIALLVLVCLRPRALRRSRGV